MFELRLALPENEIVLFFADLKKQTLYISVFLLIFVQVVVQYKWKDVIVWWP